MTILDRCQSLANSIEDYHGLQSNSGNIDRLRECHEKLELHRAALDGAVRTAVVLRKNGVLEIERDDEAKRAIELIETLRRRLGVGASRFTHGTTFTNLDQMLRDMAKGLANTNVIAWRSLCERSVPSIDGAIEGAKIVGDKAIEGSLRDLKKRAESLAGTPPKTDEEFEELGKLAEEMKSKSKSANADEIPPEVRRFLEETGKLGANSVSLELVTPSVLEWLRVHGRLREYHVRRF